MPVATKKRRARDSDDELPPVDDMNLEYDNHAEDESETELELRETPAQKRLRLARQYLQKVKDDIGRVKFLIHRL